MAKTPKNGRKGKDKSQQEYKPTLAPKPKASGQSKRREFSFDQAYQHQQKHYAHTVTPGMSMGGGTASYDEEDRREIDTTPLNQKQVEMFARMGLMDIDTGYQRAWNMTEENMLLVAERMEAIQYARRVEADDRDFAQHLSRDDIKRLAANEKIEISGTTLTKEGGELVERWADNEIRHDFQKMQGYVQELAAAKQKQENEAITAMVRENLQKEQAPSSSPTPSESAEATVSAGPANVPSFGRRARDLTQVVEATPAQVAEKNAYAARRDFIYGEPTKIERLRDAGQGAVVQESSQWSYRFDKDTNELVRFDADGNEAGRKSFAEVKAAEQQFRAREYDQQQEAAKQAAAAREIEVANLWGNQSERPEGVTEAEWQKAEATWEAHYSELDQLAAEEKEAEVQQVGQAYSHQMIIDNTPDEFLPGFNEDLAYAEGMQSEASDSGIGKWPVAVRIDELRPDFDAKELTQEEWSDSYAASRQDLQQWDGDDHEQYVDLHARAHLNGEKAGIDLETLVNDRADDIYAMSPGAKDMLDNIGVDIDNLERGVEWRRFEEEQAAETAVASESSELNRAPVDLVAQATEIAEIKPEIQQEQVVEDPQPEAQQSEQEINKVDEAALTVPEQDKQSVEAPKLDQDLIVEGKDLTAQDAAHDAFADWKASSPSKEKDLAKSKELDRPGDLATKSFELEGPEMTGTSQPMSGYVVAKQVFEQEPEPAPVEVTKKSDPELLDDDEQEKELADEDDDEKSASSQDEAHDAFNSWKSKTAEPAPAPQQDEEEERPLEIA